MHHALSRADRDLLASFESGSLAPAEFSHRAHVSLAYGYLVPGDVDSAAQAMRAGLLAYLSHQGIDAAKYHETLTRAWILAVAHFMRRTAHATSADDFIGQNPALLDTKIMLTHYSAELLFSAEARREFVAPDLEPIPTRAP